MAAKSSTAVAPGSTAKSPKPGDNNQRFAFSARVIEALGPSGHRKYYRDTVTRGLVLTVHPSGRKVFSLYRKVDGRPERISLGVFPDLDVHDARGKAEEMNAAIAKGTNPGDVARERRGEPTFAEFFAEYIEKYAKPRKRTWKEDQEKFDRHLSGWRNFKLTAVRRADVAAMHSKLGVDYPYAANRTLSLVRSLFNRAAEWGYKVENPTRGIRRFPEQSRERFLVANEMPAFFDAVLAEPNELMRDFFLLLIFTGCRSGNLATMKWQDLFLGQQEAIWRIPETKSGNAVTVTLTREALNVLRERRKVVENSEWVFPGRGRSGHVVESKTAWKRILDRAGIKDLRRHDLRRTLGSWQAATGASLPIIGKSLGHKAGSPATAIYARLDLNPVRRAVEAATKAMLAAAKRA